MSAVLAGQAVNTPAYVRNRKLIAWVAEIARLTNLTVWSGATAPRRSRTGSSPKWSLWDAEDAESGEAAEQLLALSDPATSRASRTALSSAANRRTTPVDQQLDGAREMRATLRGLFEGCMRGRTLYVIPFSMGRSVRTSARSCGAYDSPYVVVNMRIMTRMGRAVADLLGTDGAFVPACTRSASRWRRAKRMWRGRAATPSTSCISGNARDLVVRLGYGGNALLARSAWHCALPRRWGAMRAGSPNTC